MAIVLKVLKSGDRRYVVRVKDQLGKWFPARAFPRRVDAEAHERKLFEKREYGLGVAPDWAKRMTFAEYWEHFKRTHRMNVSLGWQKSQDQMARDYVLPALGIVKIAAVGSAQVNELLASMERLGRGPATRATVYRMLHRIFECAVKEDVIHVNPAKRVTKPRLAECHRKFLKPEDAWRLLNVARDHRLGPAVWLATLAGLRSEAIQALRWRSVDFDNNQLVIAEAYKRKINRIETFTKGLSADRVPLAKALADYLRERRGNANPDDFVCKTEFHRPNRQQECQGMLPYRSFYFGLRELCQRAGVEVVSPHELRHTCTELFVEQGASLEDLRRLLNHKDSNVTKLYIHRTDGRLQDLSSRIDTRGGSPAPTRPQLRLVR